MQKEFKLSPIAKNIKTYKWESGYWPGDPDYGQDTKYAVVYKGHVVAIFDNYYWSKKFVEDSFNLECEIMKVDE